MARKNHGKPIRRRENRELEHAHLGDILRKHPQVLAVLDKHGITFCPACYLTLFSPLKDVPGYHAVPDKKKFLADLRRALGK